MPRSLAPRPMPAGPPAALAPRFRDYTAPLTERVDDLVAKLTLAEKVNLMLHESEAIERLGVPAYNWWGEACHGISRNGRATVFPQVIGLAATWNRALVRRVAGTIADEARAKHHAAAAAGRRGPYQGLTFWTPNINILRDPRWGRGQETFGEDPCLTGELGVAMVRGLQGEHSRYLKTAACAKHYAVHSGPEHLRPTFDARPTLKDLTETYLPAFEKVVRAGVAAIMGADNRTLGEPCCGSRFLLGQVLRDRWGFRGHVVSDCGAIDDFHLRQGLTAGAAESAALAVRNGCDLNCGSTYRHLLAAVRAGLISEGEVDISLRRVLATRFRLGMFDPPECVPWARLPGSIVDGDAHRALARVAAVESIVLLKNNGLLPLRPDHETILVTGPTAANTSALLGSYSGVSSRLVTLLEGITAGVSEGCRVSFRTGCPLSGPTAPGVNSTHAAAAESEVTIAVLGLDPSLEGEEGDTIASPSRGDRNAIELPAAQRDFLLELRRHARQLVVVLTGGSAIAVPEVHLLADAVLQVWYPGCEGGHAVADVLFGREAPSGKLPLTVPRSTADLPAFTDYHLRGRTYRFAEAEPLYPFGFGLTYATLVYGELEVGGNLLAEGQRLALRTTVANAGLNPVAEVVQCYIVPPRSWPDAPRATLVDFMKIVVPAGARVAVEFMISSAAFAQVDRAGLRVHAPGRYGLVLGSCSPGPRAIALGAPRPATGSILIV